MTANLRYSLRVEDKIVAAFASKTDALSFARTLKGDVELYDRVPLAKPATVVKPVKPKPAAQSI